MALSYRSLVPILLCGNDELSVALNHHFQPQAVVISQPINHTRVRLLYMESNNNIIKDMGKFKGLQFKVNCKVDILADFPA